MTLPEPGAVLANQTLLKNIRESFDRTRANGNNTETTLNRLLLTFINREYGLNRFEDTDTTVRRLKVIAALQNHFQVYYPTTANTDPDKFNNISDVGEDTGIIANIQTFGEAFGAEVEETIAPNLGAIKFAGKHAVWIALALGLGYAVFLKNQLIRE